MWNKGGTAEIFVLCSLSCKGFFSGINDFAEIKIDIYGRENNGKELS